VSLNAQHAPAFAIKKISLTPRPTYVPLVAEVVAALVCLLAAFALVLLIACANLAGILLARGAARQREMAIRTALGASRGRLIRQLLTESVLICAIAAAPSLLLTVLGADAIQARLFTLLTKEGYHLQPLSPDWRVFLFTVVLALAAGIVLGLAPALGATRIDLADRMKAGAGTRPNSRPRRVREWLVIGQVTASLVLLVISGIFIRHLQRLHRADLGFDAGRVIDVRAAGPKHKLIQRLEQDPRFGTASEVYRTPVGAHGLFPLPARVDGRIRTLRYNYVDSRYFDVLGLSVRHGRNFTAQEARSQARLVVVSEATARLLWPGNDPIGKTIEVLAAEGGERFAAGNYDVIGVVPDVVSGVLSGVPDRSAIYLPAAADDPRNGGLLVRGRDASPAAIAGLKKICAETAGVDACEPVTLGETAARLRFPSVAAGGVASGLGALGLVFTCIGLYGVVAFTVVQRTREIGIRIALGAPPAGVLGSLVTQAMRRVALGIAVGIPLCLAFSTIAGNILYLVETFDLVAYVATPLFLAAVTLAAACVPACRATRIDPMTALRQE
jgi:predicted permease